MYLLDTMCNRHSDLESKILDKMILVEKAKIVLGIEPNRVLAKAIVVMNNNIRSLRKQLRGVESIIAKLRSGELTNVCY